VNRTKEDTLGRDTIGALGVIARDEHSTVEELSGGNQQKVVVGRWLAETPRVLVLDEPFRGVDIGASVSPEFCKITADVALSEPLADPRRHVLRRRLPGPLPAQGLDGVDRPRRHGNYPQNHRLRPPERTERTERPCRPRPRHSAVPSCSAAN
jgi:hypothetical protein